MAFFTVMEAFEKFLLVSLCLEMEQSHTHHHINMYERVRTPHIRNMRLHPSLREWGFG